MERARVAKGAYKRKKIKMPSRRRKSDRPDKKLLRAIYKKIYTATPEMRAVVLIEALKWYDVAWNWLNTREDKLKKLTTKQFKALNNVEIWRTRADNTKEATAKEEHLKKAIEQYEIGLVILHPKTLKSVYEKLKTIKTRLAKREDRLLDKYEGFTKLLVDVLQLHNSREELLNLRVTEMKKSWQITGDFRTLFINRKKIQKAVEVSKQQGFWNMLMHKEPGRDSNFLMDLLNWSSFIEDKTHPEKFKIDTLIRWKHLWKTLSSFTTYANNNPKFGRRVIKVKRKRRKKEKE